MTNMLQGTMAWSLEHEPLIHSCIQLIRAEEWDVQITHCYREANEVADKLANMEIRSQSKYMSFNSLPCEVKDVLLADNVRAYWPHLIRS